MAGAKAEGAGVADGMLEDEEEEELNDVFTSKKDVRSRPGL